MGSEVTRCLGGTSTKDVIQAPYWAVILTALCCGALDHWLRELDKLSMVLRVDTHLLSSDREKDELCQRCGYAYRASPLVCEPDPKRVSDVLQIDKLLLGGICTTLCATVSRHTGNGGIASGSEKEARNSQNNRGRAEWEHRYCLNHRRVYSVSCEEKLELKSGRENKRKSREKEKEDKSTKGEEKSKHPAQDSSPCVKKEREQTRSPRGRRVDHATGDKKKKKKEEEKKKKKKKSDKDTD